MGAIGGWDTGLWAIVPTIAVSLLFWFVMRAILRADRNERAAQAKYEEQLDEQALEATRHDAGLPASGNGSETAR